MTTITYREAVKSALREALQNDPRVFLMGEDVGRYGGAYACSKGLLEEFGPERVLYKPEASPIGPKLTELREATQGRARVFEGTGGIALVEGRKADHRQIDHMAFEVNDVRKLRDKLKKNGVTFFQDLHDGPYGLTVYVADPDGLKVELYEVGATA